MFAGDMLMYGGLYSGADFNVISRKIMSEIPLSRLMIGGMVGPIASVLYSLGFYHVFIALRKGSEFLAKTVLTSFVFMIITAGTFHAGFVNIGLVLKAKNAVNAIDAGVVTTLLHQTNQYVKLLFYISSAFGILGTVLFLFLVLFRKTSYPRWIVFLTPTLLVLTFHIVSYFPAPWGGIIYGGYINMAFFVFFIVSMFTAELEG